MHDLVIRGAAVVDGLGHDPVKADVAVENGRIAEEVGLDDGVTALTQLGILKAA